LLALLANHYLFRAFDMRRPRKAFLTPAVKDFERLSVADVLLKVELLNSTKCACARCWLEFGRLSAIRQYSNSCAVTRFPSWQAAQQEKRDLVAVVAWRVGSTNVGDQG
jgi:hypothetical protein